MHGPLRRHSRRVWYISTNRRCSDGHPCRRCRGRHRCCTALLSSRHLALVTWLVCLQSLRVPSDRPVASSLTKLKTSSVSRWKQLLVTSLYGIQSRVTINSTQLILKRSAHCRSRVIDRTQFAIQKVSARFRLSLQLKCDMPVSLTRPTSSLRRSHF